MQRNKLHKWSWQNNDKSMVFFFNAHSLRGLELSYLNSTKVSFVKLKFQSTRTQINKLFKEFFFLMGQRGHELSKQKGPDTQSML